MLIDHSIQLNVNQCWSVANVHKMSLSLYMYLPIVCIAFCINACHGYHVLIEDELRNATCRQQLQKVAMNEHCSAEVRVNSALIIVPNRHPYFVLSNCMNCSVTLVASPDQQIVSTLYLLGTQVSRDDKCNLNRLDVYDGDSEDVHNRLSDKDGICGCKFPSHAEFKSTNNTMTLHFQTLCEERFTQHGVLELVITAVKNDMINVTECHGEFECQNGQCIDKNLVCNGENNCRDHSDEIDCHARNDTCSGQFECLDGNCINKNLVCNGHKNCPDCSDENDCHPHKNSTCAGKFECKNGRCLDKNKVCNGENDCGDDSDETGCRMKIRLLLLYILVGLASFIVILLIVVVIILCCKYCCISFRMASVYRRFN